MTLESSGNVSNFQEISRFIRDHDSSLDQSGGWMEAAVFRGSKEEESVKVLSSSEEVVEMVKPKKAKSQSSRRNHPKKKGKTPPKKQKRKAMKDSFFCRQTRSTQNTTRGSDWIKKSSKNYGTQYSRVVPHHSTDCAITSLTSEIGRDPVLSGVYGRS